MTTQPILNTIAILNHNNSLILPRTTDGHLSLTNDALIFTPVSDGELLTIKLADILEADFTNQMSRGQFIIKTRGGASHRITMGRRYKLSDVFNLKFQSSRNDYNSPSAKKVYEAGVNLAKWREVLVEVLPAEVVKQRVELRFGSVLVAAFGISLLLISALIVYVVVMAR